LLSKSSGSLPETAPQAGDRFPWVRLRFSEGAPAEDVFSRFRDTHFHLAVVGQPVPTADELPAGDLLRVHQVVGDPENARELARAGIPLTSFYLIRPDGYVGLCGPRLEAGLLTGYFARNLHLQAATGSAAAVAEPSAKAAAAGGKSGA